MSFLVAIVGRPNVGKSTLFNRLTESREAIVDPESGVTRDRKYGKVHWQDKKFDIIDTGGYISDSSEQFDKEIRKQVQISIEEADLILFLLDVHSGITEDDNAVASILRKSDKPMMVISNKVDTGINEVYSSEFYSLGLADQVYSISANNGYGTGEMLDDLVKNIPDEAEEEERDLPKIAVIGKPNVGKSTFINTITGEDRSIVTDVAGTTRDAVKLNFNAFGFDIELIDTAGIKKKRHQEDQLEFYSIIRTIKAINDADVCMILIDAEKGFTKGDQQIFFQAIESKKGVVLCVNKWDLIEKDNKTMDVFKKEILAKTAPFVDVPVIFTSNVKKTRLLKALEEALEVYERRKTKIPTSQLNELLLEEIEFRPPPSVKGKFIRIKYVTQLPSQAPVFVFFCNLPQYIKDPYKRFLENKLRENFEFSGVPLRLFFRKK